jgi:hypothetical protein
MLPDSEPVLLVQVLLVLLLQGHAPDAAGS